MGDYAESDTGLQENFLEIESLTYISTWMDSVIDTCMNMDVLKG